MLYSFTGSPNGDGANPNAGLIMDSAGNLYGTTVNGGLGWGVVFKLDASGNEAVLHSFDAANGDGKYPYGALIMDSVGNLYGTTTGGGSANAGTAFKLDPSGRQSVLYSFTGVDSDGANPYAVRLWIVSAICTERPAWVVTVTAGPCLS